jgi:hypothetical protein
MNPPIPEEPELAARIDALSEGDARYALYWMSTGSVAVRTQVALALAAVSRRNARLAGSAR